MAGTDADGNNPTPREDIAAKNADADLDAENSTGKDKTDSASALHRFLDEIARSGGSNDAEVLREWIRPLVEEGIKEDFNIKDGDGQMLLHIAARRGLATAAKSLIVDAKANVDTQNDEGSTPLIEACWGDNMALVEILLENGADVTIFDNDGWSSLFLAARHGNNIMFQRLWKAHKWNVNLTENFTGISLLQGAAYGGSREIVQCLRCAGARLDSRDYDGWTPLFAAIAKMRKDTIDELLKGGNNEDLQLETEDFEGRTPLLKAAEDEFWDGVRILVDAGAKCNKSEASKTTQMNQTSATPPKENTALHCAVWQNNLQMVTFLREHGADINARDPDGQQPLHLASLQGNEAIVRFLLDDDKCSHLNTGDDDGMTPLHLASCPHLVDYTDSLSDSDSNYQIDEEMNSAESDPVSKAGHYNKVVHRLLARKADTTLLTKDGKTAVELAFDHNHHERGEAVLKVFSEENGGTLETLMWAAGKTERHAIGTSLVKRHLKESGSSLVGGSESWNAIEWAAHAREIRTLWLLIASSPQGKETKRILKSAKAIVEESKDQGEKSATNPDDHEPNQADETKKRNKGTTRQAILDIINNPPTGLICRDMSTYGVPNDEDKLLSSDSPYHATIVQFYKRQGEFDSIIRVPTIKETIYSQGPAGVMNKVVEQLKEVANSHLNGLRQSYMVQRPLFMDSKPKFTWIHLPATNMTWMDVGFL
ncbi:Ankyrin repeat, PH and SEC7 domain containing protein secG [Colletotrichum siamense]|nr:Ankyrin repeat, PH and SEC7 domain containing protein secG [Colletotrichum siamense]